MTLEQIKEKIAVIKNTKDIENIESILSYNDLGKNILEVLNSVSALPLVETREIKPQLCAICNGTGQYYGGALIGSVNCPDCN